MSFSLGIREVAYLACTFIGKSSISSGVPPLVYVVQRRSPGMSLGDQGKSITGRSVRATS
jgi:hypothetical protein